MRGNHVMVKRKGGGLKSGIKASTLKVSHSTFHLSAASRYFFHSSSISTPSGVYKPNNFLRAHGLITILTCIHGQVFIYIPVRRGAIKIKNANSVAPPGFEPSTLCSRSQTPYHFRLHTLQGFVLVVVKFSDTGT